MNFAEYQVIPAVNWSTLSAMRKSPLHYRYLLDHPRADTPALATGRAAHTAVFEPERFESEYVVEPEFGDCRVALNKAAKKEWHAAHADRTILTEAEHARSLAIRDAVRSHPEAARYLAKGIAEETVTWTDAKTKLACKGRLDFVSTSKPAIVDLKTARDIMLEMFARSVHRYGYHTQSAFYADGWHAAHGERLPSIIIAVESAGPFDVGVFELDEDTLGYGEEEYAELLTKVAVHRDLKTWPGQYPLPMPPRLPPWCFPDDTDDLGLED